MNEQVGESEYTVSDKELREMLVEHERVAKEHISKAYRAGVQKCIDVVNKYAYCSTEYLLAKLKNVLDSTYE